MAKRDPIPGPGKFEGEMYATRYAYENPDDELGSVDENGAWYGYFSGTIKKRGPFHILVWEDSAGFVSSRFFDTQEELDNVWAELEQEIYSEGEE